MEEVDELLLCARYGECKVRMRYDYRVAVCLVRLRDFFVVGGFAEDVLVFAVQHRQFNQLTPENLTGFYRKTNRPKVLVDVKGMYDRHALEALGFLYWSL